MCAVWSFEEDALLIWGTHEFPKKKEVVCLLSRRPLEGALLQGQDTSKTPISSVLTSEGGSPAVSLIWGNLQFPRRKDMA